MAMKTLRDPQTNIIRTVPEAEAEKLCKDDWVYTSRYEIKRKAAIERMNATTKKSEAA